MVVCGCYCDDAVLFKDSVAIFRERALFGQPSEYSGEHLEPRRGDMVIGR